MREQECGKNKPALVVVAGVVVVGNSSCGAGGAPVTPLRHHLCMHSMKEK